MNISLSEKLKDFSAKQARLIQEIIDKVVSDAISGAEVDEEEESLYHEIDYDIIYDRLSLLNNIGVGLTVEKLLEFLDSHPAVNYSDAHNTGLTLYFNESQTLQELGLLPNNGITTMQL